MTNYSKKLKSILESNLCVGCGLCEGVSNGKVKMIMNEEGFLRPDHLLEAEEEARQAVHACPGYNLTLPETTVVSDPIWGPLVECRTGHATSEKLRHLGASGGGLSALVASLLESGFADNVVHIAAKKDKPIYNELQKSSDIFSIERAAGSRYCPSAPLTAIPAMLNKGERSILVGKPCDIAGARQYLEQNPHYKDKIVLLVSFMCGGLPSIKGTKKILENLDVEEDELSSFRYRGEGWPGKVCAETKSGTKATMGYDESWGGILRNYTQFRCKICPDAVGQFADVAFADAWYVDEDNMPSFDEKDGRSMILSRTPLGEEVCNIAIDSGGLSAKPLEMNMIIKMQPFHALRKRMNFSRLLALRITGHKIPLYKNLFIMQAAWHIGFWGNMRSFLGTVRRILLKKL